jgi:hypothetical protein
LLCNLNVEARDCGYYAWIDRQATECEQILTLFAWLISHQQPANNTFLSEQTSISHQPPAKRTGRLMKEKAEERQQVQEENGDSS